MEHASALRAGPSEHGQRMPLASRRHQEIGHEPAEESIPNPADALRRRRGSWWKPGIRDDVTPDPRDVSAPTPEPRLHCGGASRTLSWHQSQQLQFRMKKLRIERRPSEYARIRRRPVNPGLMRAIEPCRVWRPIPPRRRSTAAARQAPASGSDSHRQT
jgi:hypothetical protein